MFLKVFRFHKFRFFFLGILQLFHCTDPRSMGTNKEMALRRELTTAVSIKNRKKLQCDCTNKQPTGWRQPPPQKKQNKQKQNPQPLHSTTDTGCCDKRKLLKIHLKSPYNFFGYLKKHPSILIFFLLIQG